MAMFQTSPRGNTVITITFAEMYKLVRERLNYYTDDSDPDAFCQNLCCEIEKKMGIYPNVGNLEPNHSTVRTLELDRAEQEALDNL
jgi:hypothetical protein